MALKGGFHLVRLSCHRHRRFGRPPYPRLGGEGAFASGRGLPLPQRRRPNGPGIGLGYGGAGAGGAQGNPPLRGAGKSAADGRHRHLGRGLRAAGRGREGAVPRLRLPQRPHPRRPGAGGGAPALPGAVRPHRHPAAGFQHRLSAVLRPAGGPAGPGGTF